jgi:hypothetical protein
MNTPKKETGFGTVPPAEFRIVNGRKYRAGDRYPLPKEEKGPKKTKPLTGGDE